MTSLVGYTGFVGSNLYEAGKDAIDNVYNSKNIEEAYETKPDLLIYAGLRAEKYLANHAPEKDLEQIRAAQENIRRIAPKKLVLISTVDVYKHPVGVDEDSPIRTEGLSAYGYHRYLLEQWVRERYPEALIIRLPALYGRNLKKNFIYDYINVIPSMLTEKKYSELLEQEHNLNSPPQQSLPETKLCFNNRPWQSLLEQYYDELGNGFYRCTAPEGIKRKELKELFETLAFTALNFTDSRSSYQFYPLSRLWEDLNTALEQGLKLWNPVTQPVTAGGLYRYLSGRDFVNEISECPADYDCRTKYAELFGGRDGYIMSKQEVMDDIRHFLRKQQ